METMTQEKPEVKKNYQIKKQENGKFKILNEETGGFLEGFEDKEFGSPVEASRFMKNVTKEPERQVTEFKTEGEGFQIPVIEIVGDTRYFEVIIREHDEPKRTSEPITDGFNTTYFVALGKKVILPEAVINTAREAVYTVIETFQDDKTLKCTTIPRQSPRFSVEVIRTVPQEEAIRWIREQKRTNINIL